MRRFIFLGILILALAVPAQAKPGQSKQSHSKAEQHKQHKAEESRQHKQQQMEELGEAAAEGKFSPAERNMIRARLQQQQQWQKEKAYGQLPPGLQKKVARGKALPPGWQKKVAPGEVLDSQIYRQGSRLPDDLLGRLPKAPDNSEIVQIEDKIIRINRATRAVLDVFDLMRSR